MNPNRIFRAGDAPTPFSAEEIRVGCPEGRRVVVKHETNGSTQYWVTAFVDGDLRGTGLVNQQVDEEGRGIGEEQRFRVGWEDLQGHGSFPADATTVTTVTVRSPLGESTCRLYEVTEDAKVKRLWFAVDRPGLPILTEERGLDAISKSTVISDSTP